MSVTHWHHQEEWPGEARSIRHVRGFVTTNLVRHGLNDMVDDAVLVVSELATNVVLHARTPFLVSLSRAEKHLLLEVTDASSAQPLLAWSDPLGTSGRGLSIVEILSQAWGVDNATNGAKRVWASFPIPGIGNGDVGPPMLDDPGGRLGV